MKKQYVFLLMIGIILYILYLIMSKTYYEYKINTHIEYISDLNLSIKGKIEEAEKIIEYKSSIAYKNKVLKEQQSFKNKGEVVVYLTTQTMYDKFIKVEEVDKVIITNETKIENTILDNMKISERWIYLIFKKDTY